MMHLERVEAVRYGELAGELLDGLGPRLNVVLGRNEAGKSTFTSLVRHILYGFPRGRTVERQYLPPTGDQRVGRLVFADGEQRWTIERVEGAHGGEAVVHGPQGEEPADVLLGSLTRGVSAATFAAVFGFSLEQLSDPKSLDDIGSRLYATAAGLGADPNDVLAALRGEADELWAPRARTRLIHTLNSELRELRERRRKVEESAERYRADREQRAEVAAELGNLERAVAAARSDEDCLTALLGEARRLAERAREAEEGEVEHRLAAEALQRDAAAAEVDEALLERTEAIERLSARCELFRSEIEQMRREAERLQALEAEERRMVDELGEGWSLDNALAVRLDLDLEALVEAAEERLGEARRHRDESERRAVEAEAEHAEALAQALRRSFEVGVADDGRAPEEVGVRLLGADRLLALGGEVAHRSIYRVPAAASFLIAVALAIAGLVVGDRWLVAAAVLPAALAAGLLVWPLIGRSGRSPETAALLRRLGLDELPPPGALLELKNRLEECRRLWSSAEQLGRTADARRRTAGDAAAAFEAAREEWSEWLLTRGLATTSNQPESVRRVLARLHELRDAV
ncbi:MAG: AAA family ATPase, partial [Thermoleophilia bacterium]|nr:AAA family ATPase [Thermoleophilia bacterium]